MSARNPAARRVLPRRRVLAALAGGAAAGGALAGCARREDGDGVTLPPYAHRSRLVWLGYRFAVDQPALLGQLPCYCGCVQLKPGHTSLRDCFLAPQGGFDPHAAGCAVCVDEALVARRMLADGRTVAEIRRAIDAEFGTRGPGTATPPVSP